MKHKHWPIQLIKRTCTRLTLLGCMFAPSAYAQDLPRFGNYGGPLPLPESQAKPAPRPPSGAPRWFPVQARFHPDGNRLVVNLCSAQSVYYCRVVFHDIDQGTWSLMPGQQEGRTYLHPSYSYDGKTLVMTTADCGPSRDRCKDAYGQVALLTQGQHEPQLQDIHNASRPHFRPDDQAITYWRVAHVARMASGRYSGSISAYEYTLATGVEEDLIAHLRKAPVYANFVDSYSGIRYTEDGKQYFTCGYENNHVFSRTQMTCLLNHKYGRPPTLLEGLVTQSKSETSIIGVVFHHSNEFGMLSGFQILTLANLDSLRIMKDEIFAPFPARVVDADLSSRSKRVAALALTAPLGTTEHVPPSAHIVAIRDIFRRERGLTDQIPVLVVCDISNKSQTALVWPDVELLRSSP